MSKGFVITMIVLLVLWLSLLSLTLHELLGVTHKNNVLILEHEVDLVGIKIRMRTPMIQAGPAPQVAPPMHPLPRRRRRLVAGTSEYGSPGIELTAAHRCW